MQTIPLGPCEYLRYRALKVPFNHVAKTQPNSIMEEGFLQPGSPRAKIIKTMDVKDLVATLLSGNWCRMIMVH